MSPCCSDRERCVYRHISVGTETVSFEASVSLSVNVEGVRAGATLSNCGITTSLEGNLAFCLRLFAFDGSRASVTASDGIVDVDFNLTTLCRSSTLEGG